MQRRDLIRAIGLLALTAWPAGPEAQESARGGPPARRLVIRSVRIFDGRSERLREGADLLVEGNAVKALLPAGAAAPEGAETIDGGGRVLMPGLIDCHVHLTFTMPPNALFGADPLYLGARAARAAEQTLMRGFTTVRDVGGPAFGIKRAIDEGLAIGPRIYPSGALISQTSGHADFRTRTEQHPLFGGAAPRGTALGAVLVADGEAQVLAAVREQLRLGASQIKLAAGGGLASPHDPVDVSEYLPEELRAAVRAAADWGTYVVAHVYNAEGARRALEAGVRSIEHGHLIDDEGTMRLLVEKGAFLSTQVVPFTPEQTGPDPARPDRAKPVREGMDAMARLAKAHGAKVVFGTDLLFSMERMALQNREFGLRLRWFTPPEILRQATSVAAELLALSGRRNPYPGRLGVIEEGAYADLLIVEGNPLEDIRVLEDPEKNLGLIMKDGTVYKNKL